MRFIDYKTDGIGTVTVLPDAIANQLITTYNIDFTPYPEGMLDILMHSSLDQVNASLPGIIKALQFLNKKLEAARKTISFWDAYQIKETIEDKEQMLGQLSNMPVNTSIVSNLRDPFNWLNESNKLETIYRGDLLIKDYNGRIHLIHGTSQGFYKPNSVTQPTGSQSATINYIYQENVSNENVTSELDLSGRPAGYNRWESINAGDTTSKTFSAILATEDPADGYIMPVVKYYTEIPDGNVAWKEIVVIDTNFKLVGSTITIPNPTSIALNAEVK